jgi:hypothetical protein
LAGAAAIGYPEIAADRDAEQSQIAFADDPTNRDTNFTRPRLRALMPALAEEGGDVRNLARLADGWPGPMPRWKCWSMARSAISA